LVQGPDADLYGTSPFGGSGGGGNIFKLSTSGTLTSIYNFTFIPTQPSSNVNGYDSVAGLILAQDGNFYGTTAQGGIVVAERSFD